MRQNNYHWWPSLTGNECWERVAYYWLTLQTSIFLSDQALGTGCYYPVLANT